MSLASLEVCWSANWGQLIFIARLGLYGFATTIERLDTTPDSVPNVELLVIHLF